jgi:hypothetical protein
MCFSEAIALVHNEAETFFWRGKTLMAIGKFPEAIYDFTWALKLGGKDSSSPVQGAP